jgi:non-ribosomal peptide synthetase component F
MGRVEELGRAEGVTPFVVLLSVYFVLLARYTGERDLVVGIRVVRRPDPDVDCLIGNFVNTLAIRVDAPGGISFRTLMAGVAEAVYEAFENMDVQFDEVVRIATPQRADTGLPLVPAGFALQTAELTGELRLPDVAVEVLEDEQVPSAEFDLSLDLIEHATGFRGELGYATDLFTEATMRRAAGHWLRLLEALTDGPDTEISAVPLFGAGEEHHQPLTVTTTPG